MKLTILWIYIVLLFAGGMMGFIKAGSKASIITSTIFAALLALCAVGLIAPVVTDVVLVILMVVFALRFAKGRKFMPSGLMAILTVTTLALRHLL